MGYYNAGGLRYVVYYDWLRIVVFACVPEKDKSGFGVQDADVDEKS